MTVIRKTQPPAFLPPRRSTKTKGKKKKASEQPLDYVKPLPERLS